MSSYAAESKRLYLQPLSVDEHLNDYYQIMSHPESMLWSRSSPHTSLQETLALILASQPTPEQPWNTRYAILLRSNPSTPLSTETQKLRMIGVVGTPREAELAYKIHPDYWGKGYMSEALQMFLDLFWQSGEQNSYDHLTAFADPENLASTRVLEKAGFQKRQLLKGYYERAALQGAKKSDLQHFVLERPNR